MSAVIIDGKQVAANVRADVAKRVASLEGLPVIKNEIGDTWIHGAGTDPQKVSRFKRVLRYIKENGINADLSDNLLLVPEHTWGMDVKTFFPDKEHFTYREMENLPERAVIEKSWYEQRQYAEKAEKLLGLRNEYDTSIDSKLNIEDIYSDTETFADIYDNKYDEVVLTDKKYFVQIKKIGGFINESL